MRLNNTNQNRYRVLLTAGISADLMDELVELSQQTGESKSAIVRHALRTLFSRYNSGDIHAGSRNSKHSTADDIIEGVFRAKCK